MTERFSRDVTSCPTVTLASQPTNTVLDKICHHSSAAEHKYVQMVQLVTQLAQEYSNAA